MDLLPVELLRLLIEQYLGDNQQKLCELCLVNKTIYQISLPQLWRRPKLFTEKALESFLLKCGELIPPTYPVTVPTAVYGQWVEEWSLTSTELTKIFNDDHARRLLSVCARRLKRLDFAHCTELTLEFMIPWLQSQQSLHPVSFESLEALSLEECRKLDLEAFRLFLYSTTANLRTLNLSCVYSVNNDLLIEIGRRCGPNLTALNLNFCHEISDRGLIGYLREASQHFNQVPALRQLSLDSCHRLTSESLMRLADICPQLQYLRLNACKSLEADCLFYLLERCGANLHYLLLTSCNQMVSDSSLRAVIERLEQKTPGKMLALRYLDISFCTEIRDIRLFQRFLTYCPQLTSLVIKCCRFLYNEKVRALSKPPPSNWPDDYQKWYCHIKGRASIEQFIQF